MIQNFSVNVNQNTRTAETSMTKHANLLFVRHKNKKKQMHREPAFPNYIFFTHIHNAQAKKRILCHSIFLSEANTKT